MPNSTKILSRWFVRSLIDDEDVAHCFEFLNYDSCIAAVAHMFSKGLEWMSKPSYNHVIE
jgi:hypothetical protein